MVAFLLSIPLYTNFLADTAAMQFVEKSEWIPAFHIFYHLGVDGISMPLILLTTFTTVLVVISGQEVIRHRASQYMASFLILEGLMVGAFAALDAVLFYVFWEALLVPMFLIIGIWGGENRVYATIKFFLYTFLGSVLMLVAFLYLYAEAGELPDSRLPRGAARARRAGVPVPRVPRRVRGQGAHVAGAHAGCRTPTSRRRPGAR